MKEKTLHVEQIFKGGYLSLEKRLVELADGKQATREIVRAPDGVGIVAVNERNEIYLVEQFRSPVEKIVLEIPAGIMDKQAESAQECALRELKEETGVVARSIMFMTKYYHAIGYSTSTMQLFYATDLEETNQTSLDSGEFLRVVKKPLAEMYAMLDSGRFIDAKTQIALLMLRNGFGNI
ncbi:NUDIX hydrolase [Candidatus Woesearchaeota archaeon]|nr:NUDIX hydrolase [Candidatus Woesearchaeota archaeon]